MINDLILNKDFLRFIPDGANDQVTAIVGILYVIRLVNEKNQAIGVPMKVIYAYGDIRRELNTKELGYIGEAWANICGVNDGSITYKEHELKGKEVIDNLDRLLIEKLKEDLVIH